jgi:hypothetical protein
LASLSDDEEHLLGSKFELCKFRDERTRLRAAMPAGPDAPRIVDFSAVVAVINALPHAQVIEAIAAGFVSYSRGQVSVPQIQTLGHHVERGPS